MKLSFIKKKKVVTLESTHEKGVSPRFDWAKMLVGLFVFLAVSAVYSAFLFFSLLNGEEVMPNGFSSSDSRPTLDEKKLGNAVDFIDSLKSD